MHCNYILPTQSRMPPDELFAELGSCELKVYTFLSNRVSLFKELSRTRLAAQPFHSPTNAVPLKNDKGF